jgi:hypothetical protein
MGSHESNPRLTPQVRTSFLSRIGQFIMGTSWVTGGAAAIAVFKDGFEAGVGYTSQPEALLTFVGVTVLQAIAGGVIAKRGGNIH